MRKYTSSICIFLASLLLASSVLAQTSGSVRLFDEGVQQGKVENIDCIGSTIACARVGVTGTLTLSGGGGGAPTDATYWVGAGHAGLSAEINLGALGTGLVINTAGTPSIYAGVTCTNQVLRVLSASGGGTCVTITSAYTSGTFPADTHALLSATHSDTAANAPLRGSIIRGNVTPAWERLALGGANLYLKSNATDLIYSTLAAGGVGGCTNQAVITLNADAVPTCATITSAYVDASIVPSTRTISTVAPLSGGGDLSANRTITTSMSTARLLGRTTAGTGVAEEITVNGPLTFSAGVLDITAIADADLASSYSGIGACGANTFASTLNDNAAPTCTQPAFSNLSGSLAFSQTSMTTAQLLGRTTAGTGVIEQISVSAPLVFSSLNLSCPTCLASAYATIEDEGTPLTQRTTVNFTGAGISCSDSGGKTVCNAGGGAGSSNVVEVSIPLGTEMGLYYSATVTSQSWVTSSSVIACSMFGTSADGQTDETIAVAGIIPTVSDRSAGVGFNLNLYNPNGATGTVRAHCTGA